MANVDWLERLAGSEPLRDAVPHHRCEAPSVIDAKEKPSHCLAINTSLLELSAIYLAWVSVVSGAFSSATTGLIRTWIVSSRYHLLLGIL